MRIDEKIEDYLNEGYKPDLEIGRIKRELEDWLAGIEEEASNDMDFPHLKFKKLRTARQEINKALSSVEKNIKTVGGIMKLF